MGKRGRKYAAQILVVTLLLPSHVQAQTTSDLYDKYGIDDTTAYALQSKVVSSLTQDYNDKSNEYNYCVEYNTVIEKLDIATLRNNLEDDRSKLESMQEEILLCGIDGTYDQVLFIMDEYSKLQRSIEQQDTRLKKYESMTPKDVPDYNFDELAQVLTEEEESLNSIEESSDIGDIDSIYNFLQASYTLKRKFDGTGLMLKAVPGTGVLSVFNGTVIYSERNEITGETISVDSGDGIVITYHGLTARYVQSGDVVEQYQKIATTGEDLYVTLSINGVYYDLDMLYGG